MVSNSSKLHVLESPLLSSEIYCGMFNDTIHCRASIERRKCNVIKEDDTNIVSPNA